MVGEMMQRHAELQEAVAMLEAEIGAFEPRAGGLRNRRGRGRGRARGLRKVGRPVGRGAGRPRGPRTKNKMSLPDFLVKVLTGTTMGVSEAATAVKRAGYQTSSPNFRTMVNQALLANKSRFKKVARGQYTAK